jgi:hypothetical protein
LHRFEDSALAFERSRQGSSPYFEWLCGCALYLLTKRDNSIIMFRRKLWQSRFAHKGPHDGRGQGAFMASRKAWIGHAWKRTLIEAALRAEAALGGYA